ncbi:DNA alkylation repair protein [Pedobacter sandarakinus]|uniref:DNA alkylation repair protein n=1 Tax=Pedobacter sandarakinus TaxID=353156 RepID=UPI00224731C0|nr:DNA alkylation repair protein [Pedobacter sandarakinus]MCX2574757.1 DNA alkylation repair protein [Pedobacter sandarakinus]
MKAIVARGDQNNAKLTSMDLDDVDQLLSELRALSEPNYVKKMAHFGIDVSRAFGIRVPKIRALAKVVGKNQSLSLRLWATGFHEARLLASFIGDYKLVDEAQISAWTRDFNSWDICDQACATLFVKTPFVSKKVFEFAKDDGEFVKRAGFVLMAALAVHLKKAPNETFLEYFPLIEMAAADQRNFVKKVVNWALRQIGKRNALLHAEALQTAQRILAQQNKNANWVALDALRELNSDAVLRRLRLK